MKSPRRNAEGSMLRGSGQIRTDDLSLIKRLLYR
jgi:hypothetical protein